MKKFFVFLILFFLGLGIFIWQGVYLPKSSDSVENKLFLIEKGQDLFQIAQNLEKEGLIRNKIFFEIYVVLKGKAKALQAGKYFLNSSMSIPRLVEKFVWGDVVRIKITIPEGFTLEQIDARLAENISRIPRTLLGTLRISEFKNEFDFLEDAPDTANLEGFLFPDTYYFSGQERAEEIIRIFLDNFDRKLAPYRNKISGSGLTLYDIITMASLLEKEAKTKEEKEIISGILWKRLKNNVPLQVDATIVYITGRKTTKISKEETQIDSPYNTYKYAGLPIGPICNPGLDSILAALYPEDSQYRYYLSTPEGETIFSKTLQEHNIAKAKYLR